ncbi:subtilisin-like protease SBT3 [Lycium ferocissimum]|uniref:subtilisin-like protease SBT3 n=1 Tax=Lycium ferocissimum TaxID=112874 RepID=UPI002814D0D3|nr:subtilisin-like protease SBT3 [Lycium ferocissimum]
MANSSTMGLCFFAILILLLPSTTAQSETYIIHMDSSAMPKVFSSHHAWYLATLSSVLNSSSLDSTISRNSLASSKLVYAYTDAIHGFSASLSPSEHEAIKNSPGYVSSVKDMTVKLHTSHTSYFLGLNSMSGAWPKSDYGKGVIIGVVDSGVWPESKSYSDDGMSQVPSRWKGACVSGTQFNSSLCNKKLIGARYYNKGLLAKVKNLTITMNSPRDTDGHGTHTSSTAAGNLVEGASYFDYAPGTIRGVAPKAHVAVYKAFWGGGGASSDILAAMDQAIMDKVDVLSLSFGFDYPPPLYMDTAVIAAYRAMEKGIFVSASAGNGGSDDRSLSNEAPWILSVAASTVNRALFRNLTLGNGVSIEGFSLYAGNSSSSDTSIVLLKTCLDKKEFQNVTDKFVVCLDKNGLIDNQVENVRDSKAAGAIFISNDVVTYVELFIKTEFPAVFLNLKDGDEVLKYINCSSMPKARIGLQGTRIGVQSAPAVAHFSSRGPSKYCPFILKPDLTAPGDLILASWPPIASVSGKFELYNIFNIDSGTSMSCPHAAGVAALLKEAHPEWSPAAIRSAMMTTAYVLDNTQSPIQDIGKQNAAATPLAIGAGHINPNKAMDPGLIYDITPQDYINLLCALNLTSKQIKTITRSYYTCSSPSLDLNYPSFIGYFNSNSSKSDPTRIQEFQRTVTNVGDNVSEYTAMLAPMPGFKVSVVPEKLVFKEKYEKQSYKLRIEGPTLMDDSLVHGSVRWVEKRGKYVVRSPIVATSLNDDPFFRTR